MRYEARIYYSPFGVEVITTSSVDHAEQIIKVRYNGLTRPRKAEIVDEAGRIIKKYNSIKNFY